MERLGARSATPIVPDGIGRKPVLGLTSGYVSRAAAILPSQGDRDPWHVPQNYLRDLAAMTFARIDEGLKLG
jgi:hypothetical protein